MKSGGATTAATGRRDRLKSWIANHYRVCVSTLGELRRSPVSSGMTWLVIGIALALPAILYVMLDNISEVSGDWGGEPRVSLYLNVGVTVAEASQLAAEIRQAGDAGAVQFISSQEALKEFQVRSGFGDVLNTLDRNPLPHVIEVVPVTTDTATLKTLIIGWEARSEVNRASVDLAWLERLYALLQFGERLVLSLTLVLGLGVMLVMGNTIRLAIENRRQEIEVVKLVGGTDAFVRRPFLYLGFWYGLGGAVVAFSLLQLSLVFLSGPVEVLAQSYRDEFALTGPGFTGYMILLTGGASLGIAGAVLAVSRHLSDIEPK